LGTATIRGLQGVLPDPAPFALVETLGDSSVTIRFFGWVDQTKADFGKVKSEALRLVKQAFDDAEIQMPEPIYRVLMRTLPDEERARPAPPEFLKAVDVSVDTELEEQVQEDLQTSEEPNLLNEKPERKQGV